jgi:hypothetical protein
VANVGPPSSRPSGERSGVHGRSRVVWFAKRLSRGSSISRATNDYAVIDRPTRALGCEAMAGITPRSRRVMRPFVAKRIKGSLNVASRSARRTRWIAKRRPRSRTPTPRISNVALMSMSNRSAAGLECVDVRWRARARERRRRRCAGRDRLAAEPVRWAAKRWGEQRPAPTFAIAIAHCVSSEIVGTRNSFPQKLPRVESAFP